MMILASGASSTKYNCPDVLGALFSPGGGSSVVRYIEQQMKWAMDNGCFNGLDEKKFIQMLERNKPYASSCLWCVVPDVFDPTNIQQNAARTLDRFREWAPRVRAYGYPLALVAQNGLEHLESEIPWDEVACLFIGGDTDWKLGPHAAHFTREAKKREKWVHMGRVNSIRRLDIAAQMGCDSVDGQSFNRFGRDNLKWALSQCTFYNLAGGQDCA